jgi:hypothetical protein
MMSSTETSLVEFSLFDAVKKQYLYKLKSHLGLFLAMAGVQVIALLFSLGGVMSHGMGTQYLYTFVSYFSSEIVIGFTILWVLVVAVLVTTKDYQNIDFTFVSNRLSSNLSNAAFLVTAALIGGFTAMLSGFLLRIIVYFRSSHYLLSQNFIVAPDVIFTGIAVTLLYLLLFGSLGLDKGAVSPFGILNDTGCIVEVVVDKDILAFEHIGVPPNDNTATLWIRPQDLESIIRNHGNVISYIDV